MDEPLIVSKGRYELSIMALFKEKGIEPIFKYEFNHPDTALNFIRRIRYRLIARINLKSHDRKIMLRGAGTHLYRQISLLAKEPPVEGSPLFLLQNVWKH